MNRIPLVLFTFFCMLMTANAQDLIIMKDGDVVKTKVMEITGSEVKYKKFSNLDGPLYTIEKPLILSIVYENGEKDVFGTTEHKALQTEQVEDIADVSISAEENEKLKQRYYVNIERTPKEMQKKKGNKKATAFLCQLVPTSDAVLADKNVELELKHHNVNTSEAWNQAIKVIVKNKSNKMLYIDLASTYFVRGSSSTPYYIPVTTTTTNIASNGAAVSVIPGVTVGGSNTSATTTTVHRQRILSLPPMSTIDLPARSIVLNGASGTYDIDLYIYENVYDILMCTNPGIRNLEELNWTEEESKIKIAAFVTYSASENMQNPHCLNASFYSNKMIAVPEDYSSIKYTIATKKLLPSYKNALFFLGMFR